MCQSLTQKWYSEKPTHLKKEDSTQEGSRNAPSPATGLIKKPQEILPGGSTHQWCFAVTLHLKMKSSINDHRYVLTVGARTLDLVHRKAQIPSIESDRCTKVLEDNIFWKRFVEQRRRFHKKRACRGQLIKINEIMINMSTGSRFDMITKW